jgi:hypothetical protein
MRFVVGGVGGVGRVSPRRARRRVGSIRCASFVRRSIRLESTVAPPPRVVD